MTLTKYTPFTTWQISVRGWIGLGDRLLAVLKSAVDHWSATQSPVVAGVGGNHQNDAERCRAFLHPAKGLR